MTNDSNYLTELFGDPISVYTRAQAIEDGSLVDVTEQAGSGPDGMLNGFTCPVAMTSTVWGVIERIPASLDGIADVRGRLHDVLWMARLAAKRGGDAADFVVILPSRGSRKRNRTLRMVAGPGDAGELVITIGFATDF